MTAGPVMPGQHGRDPEHVPAAKARAGFEAHVRDHGERPAAVRKSAVEPHPAAEEVVHATIAKSDMRAPQDATLPLDLRLAEQGAAARIYPQSLHVNGYLSLWDPVERSRSSASPLQGAEVETASPATSLVQRAGPVAVAVGSAMTGNGALPLEAVSVWTSVSPSDVGTPAVRSRIAATGDTSVEWARQFLRLDLQGRAATLWLRDFRLDEAGRRALAAQLLVLARDAGKPVGRVMANGQELWRDGAWTPTDSKGETHGR